MRVDRPSHVCALYTLVDMKKLIDLFSVFCNAILTILNVNKCSQGHWRLWVVGQTRFYVPFLKATLCTKIKMDWNKTGELRRSI
jgi:hypothetical protein